jgi:uncharacterized membrane protein
MVAISTGYYDSLKFFHVLASITWVGSAIYAQVLATKVTGEGDPARIAATAKDIGDLGKRLITPAAIAVLVFGVWLVAVSAWNFTDAWVALGLVGITITIVTGAGLPGTGVRADREARGRAGPIRPRDPAADQADLRHLAHRPGRADPGRGRHGVQAGQLSPEPARFTSRPERAPCGLPQPLRGPLPRFRVRG